MTQTQDDSDGQTTYQPTTKQPSNFTQEHHTTQQKQHDVQRVSSGKSASISASTEIQSPPYPQSLRKKR